MNPRSCALIVNDVKELLLVHRMKDEREYWVFPGGSIEKGETAEEAVIREIEEETSLSTSNIELVFEQSNEGRRESYFSIGAISGEVKLGNGPEQERQSSNNQYELIWVNMEKLENVNLQPVSAKEKVISLLRTGKL
ncbi:NUDIX domain-containing protein [Reinekea marina]|uniref:NUDIX domain-containing protein n=1 Tax=Reinekea marina TaxID=1310421 RepID=A0ABV7WYA2_9GAMM|nr:NUDIX domain-containing protein [Reinekea marina]MDN3649555.1 NUDIX domain-containing protein [Reinekea marina]